MVFTKDPKHGQIINRIGIIGNGVVGSAIARTYLDHYQVRIYDHVPERSTHSLDEVLDSNLSFICLPEKAINGFFRSLRNHPANFVLKSTVPINTTKQLQRDYHLENLVHSPEFLTQRCSFIDSLTPSRNIIGVPDWSTSKDGGIGNKAFQQLNVLYHTRFPGVSVHIMSSDESEAVKLFTNGFFATKVAFFNEINTLSNYFDLDWNTVLAGMLSDGRIAHSHTQVPGPDGQYGFGGSCLPKDLNCLIATLESSSLPSSVTSGASRRNLKDRTRQDTK